jgi:DNA-binding transcriptional LysR family regulator
MVSIISMDTAQLLAFQRVVREGTFSRAALTLNLGQPALSARIQALEAEVGGQLFTRGRRVALTALGAHFLPYARRVLETLDEGVRVARSAERGEQGRVTFASLGSLAGGLIGPALVAFTRAHAAVECLARSGDHEFVLELLWDGVVELGLVAWPCHDATARELRPLAVFRESVVLATHAEHPLARSRTTTRAALVRLGRPLLRLRWWQNHDPTLVRLAEESASNLEVPMETARCLVREGAAVGFFPRTYIAEDLARGALVELKVRDLAPLVRESALVRRSRETPLSPATLAFAAAIEAQAANLALKVTKPR